MAKSILFVARTDATHRIALERLAKLVAQWLETRGMQRSDAEALVGSDYAGRVDAPAGKARPVASVPQRQARHLAA